MDYHEQYIEIYGNTIYSIGEGRFLIFLHGELGDEHRYFLPHLECLPEHFKLIFYDYVVVDVLR